MGTVENSGMAGKTGRPTYVVARDTGQAEGGSGNAGSAGRGAGLGNGVAISIIVVAILRGTPRHAENSVVHTAIAGRTGSSVSAGVAIVEALSAYHGR